MTDLTPDIDPLYTTRKVAAMFQVTTETVRNWVKAGKIKGQTVEGSPRYYIARSEVIRFANEKHGDPG